MAVRFDAETDALKRTGGLGLTSDATPWTYCGWFCRRVDRNAFTGAFYIGDGTTSFGESIDTDGTGDPITSMDINGTDQIVGPNWVDDQWYFLAVTNTGTTKTFYWKADGVGSLSSGQDTTIDTTQLINCTQLWVGDVPWSAEWFNGSVCCARLWNAALSESELLSEANSATAVRTSNLQGAWRLETAADLADTSGNSRTLTAGSTAVATDAAEPADIAAAAQVARPSADAFVGTGWVNEAAASTNLYQSIDETTASDTDFVRSPDSPNASVYVCDLEALTDPAVSTGHVLRYRYDRETVSGAPTVNLVVQLRQGYVNEGAAGTLIASNTHNGISDTLTDGSLPLSGTEADNITDYADLSVRFVATQA